MIARAVVEGELAVIVLHRAGDGELYVLYANDALLRLTGYEAAEATGARHDFLRGPDTSPQACAQLDRAMLDGSGCDLAIQYYRRDGSVFWGGVTLTPAPDDASPGRFLLFIRDVTVHQQVEQNLARLADRLHGLAMSDPLTGVANRRGFDAVLEREWGRAMRLNSPMALAMIDIDHFKHFNDQFGHPAGDVCLRAVASTLQATLRRPTDVLGRYGGEEFAVVMPEVDLAGAVHMGERLVSAVRAAPLGHPDLPHGRIRVSVGVAAAWAASCDGGVQRLIQQADRALYRAKAAGRDRMQAAAPRD